MISSTADCHKAKTTALTFMTENVSVNSSQTFAQCSVELWEAKPAPGVIDFFGGYDRVGTLDPLNMLYIMYITLYITHIYICLYPFFLGKQLFAETNVFEDNRRQHLHAALKKE